MIFKILDIETSTMFHRCLPPNYLVISLPGARCRSIKRSTKRFCASRFPLQRYLEILQSFEGLFLYLNSTHVRSRTSPISKKKESEI